MCSKKGSEPSSGALLTTTVVQPELTKRILKGACDPILHVRKVGIGWGVYFSDTYGTFKEVPAECYDPDTTGLFAMSCLGQQVADIWCSPKFAKRAYVTPLEQRDSVALATINRVDGRAV